jgi:hypothetical protein
MNSGSSEIRVSLVPRRPLAQVLGEQMPVKTADDGDEVTLTALGRDS